MLVIIATQKVKAQDTTNLLSNGSFNDQTTSWELDGNVAYDGNNYGEINNITLEKMIMMKESKYKDR